MLIDRKYRRDVANERILMSVCAEREHMGLKEKPQQTNECLNWFWSYWDYDKPIILITTIVAIKLAVPFRVPIEQISIQIYATSHTVIGAFDVHKTALINLKSQFGTEPFVLSFWLA